MANWILLWLIVLISLYTDLMERKIYNKVLLPGVLLALGLNLWEAGMAGMLASVKGLLIGLGIFLIPFLLGGIGAGDVKLMGFIGAVKGAIFVALTGLGTGVAGGLIALVILLREQRLLEALRRIGSSLFLFWSVKNRDSLQALDQQEFSKTFPYGVAITCGVLAATLLTIT